MISLKEYSELQKKYSKRSENSEMFTLKLTNTHSVKKTAEILSNKSGFSGNNTILGFEETEVNTWNNDFPNIGLSNGRIVGIVYDTSLEKFVVFKNDSTRERIKIYTIEDDNTQQLRRTLNLNGNPLGGANEVIYSSTNNKYYLVGNGASSRLSMYIINGTNFTLASGKINLTGQTTVRGGIGINETTGNIFFTDGFATNDTFQIFNPNTQSNVISIVIPSVSGGYATKGVVYDSVNNKYFVISQGTPKSEIFSIDVNNSYAVTKIFEYNYNSNGEIAIIDNKLFVIAKDVGNQMLLQKFDLQTETLLSSRTIKENAVSGFFLITDNKKNFYIAQSQKLECFDVDGNLINNFTSQSQNLFIGGNEMTIQSSQFFNTKNNTFCLQGATTNGGGSVLITSPNFVGGLSDFELQSSSSSYTSANTDFNINPITVSSMTLFYKNGGVSLSNSLKYSYSSATGKETRKLITPKSYLDPKSSDDKIIEINFTQPIIIDSKHFFKVDLEPSEEITFAFFYKQSDIVDILTNKFFLR